MRVMVVSFLVALSVIVYTICISAQTYDPQLFTVCPELSCYSACPAGDFSFCFCISYDGEPLMAPPSEVFMKIECFSGDLPLCEGDSPDKPSYLVYGTCFNTPRCGRNYCWYVQGSGWCENARISLHMADDPTCFYQEDVFFRSFDVTWDGIADHHDVKVIEDSYGEYVPHLDIACDGVIDIWDIWWSLYITPNHLEHSCSILIGTDESSWGAIKSIYR
jgi:hypothetical protein